MDRFEILHIESWRIKKSEENGEANYKFTLGKNAKRFVFEEVNCIAFYQARRLNELKDRMPYKDGKPDKDGVIDFSDVFVCVDICNKHGKNLRGKKLDGFEHIYKRGFTVVNKKDEKNVTENEFLSFEASSNMTRGGRLMFVNSKYKKALVEATTMFRDGEEPKECLISKWLSYKGLCLSSGTPVSGRYIVDDKTEGQIDSNIIDRVIVVEDCKDNYNSKFITSLEKDENGVNCEHLCEHTEVEGNHQINWFDGAGLISTEYMERIRSLKDEKGNKIFGNSKFTSIQFRMPFCKGMLHEVDFKKYFNEECGLSLNKETIKDCWGNLHKIKDIDIILTQSQFKAKRWFENLLKAPRSGLQSGERSPVWTAWDEYSKRFKEHDHRLFITGKNKTDDERGGATLLNYQMLSTLYFNEEDVKSLVNESAGHYKKLKADDTAKLLYFLNPNDMDADVEEEEEELEGAEKKKQIVIGREDGTKEIISAGLSTNAQLIREAHARMIINNALETIRKKAAIGKLYVSGKVRYLCPDLLVMMNYIAAISMDREERRGDKGKIISAANWAYNKRRRDLDERKFFAPPLQSPMNEEKTFSLTRNPHVAQNEHVTARLYSSESSNMRKYLWHLDGVCMINPRDFFAERMGGADFDGDLVRITDNEIIVEAARKGLQRPWIKISSKDGNVVKNVIDNHWETVKKSINSRVGEFSNIAYKLSAMAYGYYLNDSDDSAEKQKECTKLLERMVMFIGREIDRVKTGATVANVPKLPLFEDYLEYADGEESFLDKKDNYKNRTSKKKKDKKKKQGKSEKTEEGEEEQSEESKAKHILNRVEPLFEEFSKEKKEGTTEELIKEKKMSTTSSVPLAKLIIGGGNAEKMKIDVEKVKSLSALLLAYNSIGSAIKQKSLRDIRNEPIGAESSDAVTGNDEDDDEEFEHTYLRRVIFILSEQGRENPKELADEIAGIFGKARSGSLAVQLVKLEKSRLWQLTAKNKREKVLADVFAEIFEGFDENDIAIDFEHAKDVLTDFTVGGYNLLTYFLRYAKWRRLRYETCTRFTLTSVKEALEDAIASKQMLEDEGEEKEAKSYKGIIDKLEKRWKYINKNGGKDTGRYSELVIGHYNAFYDAHEAKKNIDKKCKAIAGEIFEVWKNKKEVSENAKMLVYAAMRNTISCYGHDTNHVFFWNVAGEIILKYDMLENFNDKNDFSLPRIEKDNDEFDKKNLERYRYLYRNYIADNRRVDFNSEEDKEGQPDVK